MTILSPYHFILMFSVIALLHEIGHWLCALLMRIEVTRFTFGIGPQLFSVNFTMGSAPFTVAVRLIPLGGSLDVSDKSFGQSKLATKSLVLVGGALSNLVTAMLGLAILLFYFTPSESPASFSHQLQILQTTFPLTWHFLQDTFFNASSLTNQDLTNIRLAYHYLASSTTLWYIAIFSFYNILSGVLNLLPLPGLDGGRLVSSILEEYNVTSNSATEIVHRLGITILTWLTVGYSLFWLSLRLP